MTDEEFTIRPQSDKGGADLEEAGLTPSAGLQIRHARKESGWPTEALARILKVPVRTLETLEQDRLHLLSDAMFARAIAVSVCRSLKLDSGPISERLAKASFLVSGFCQQRPVGRLLSSSRQKRLPFTGPVPSAVWGLGIILMAGVMLGIHLPSDLVPLSRDDVARFEVK